MVRALIACCVLLLAAATESAAQIQAQLVTSGLTQPVAFVQHPTLPNVQYIVQQTGQIRSLINGVLGSDLLALSTTTDISAGGERGLLGMAFDPLFATTRRFFLNFTNPSGHTVVARFRLLTTNPPTVEPASRFDLVWPGNLPYIEQPFSNHNGGHLAFGPDNMLYIGMGDGGSGDDPGHRAQSPGTLLGKMLRIDVSVDNDDTKGYSVPAGNPYAGDDGVLDEIWSFGLRNPWRYSFDDPSRGGTGALLIGDVGQNAWEEIDYEAWGSPGGVNYGWRNREGAHDYIALPAPFSTPLTNPIHEYSHGVGHSVTGGIVYRGSALGAGYFGRYFFGDFTHSRVWSLSVAGGVAGSLIEHTALLGSGATWPSSFGVDSNGELYIVSYAGSLYRLVPGGTAMTNGSFSDEMAGWSTFATPDASYMAFDIVDGVFEFIRIAPPPGEANQAVVFQTTPMALPEFAPVLARFDLGNSSTVRKRIKILIHEPGFNDFFACTFWLAPGAPLRTYEMRTHTTIAWSSTSIAFYASTTGFDNGTYRIDNVVLQYDPSGAAAGTLCVDPTAPPTGTDEDEPNLISNGTFDSDLPPWSLFGDIVGQVNAGVFEFHRPPGPTAGVILQNTHTQIFTNEIVTATFQLGNSSTVRKRATILLHDNNFTDIASCTFWLPPGQLLLNFGIRTFATKDWDSAWVAVYPSSVGTEPSIRLDNVTFKRTPVSATIGTQCFEAGGAPVPASPAFGLGRVTFRPPGRVAFIDRR